MAKNLSTTPYKGSISCATYLVKQSGVTALFRGMTATILRDVPGYMAYFASYKFCKDTLVGNVEGDIFDQTVPQFIGQLASGGIAGVVGWFPGYPFEIIKTRLQNGDYPTIRSCFKGVVNEYGYRIFYRGLGMTLLRAIPVNATTFLVYEILMGYFSTNNPLK